MLQSTFKFLENIRGRVVLEHGFKSGLSELSSRSGVFMSAVRSNNAKNVEIRLDDCFISISVREYMCVIEGDD